VLVLAAAACVLAALPARAQDVYCSITKVTTKALSNGATITVEADGMLQHYVMEGGWRRTDRLVVYLTNARSALEDDLIRPKDVYPISYIQFTVPQDAPNGIGLHMEVQLADRCRCEIPEQTEGDKLVINIKSERAIHREEGEGEKEGEKEGEAEGELEVTYEDGKLTVRALKADIHRVVAEIAREAGANVAVDDKVQRKVSLNVTGLSVDRVLQGIASGYGLAISAVGDVQMLSEGIPTDLPTYGRSATTSYPLTYLKVDDAASLLPPFLIEYLRRNPQQNSIVVTAPRQMLEKIGRDLTTIDVAPPLIMVEVLAVEITKDGSSDEFLDWVYHMAEIESSGSTETGEFGYAEGESYGLSGGVITTRKLATHVRAFLQSGGARIRAQPKMAAMNGERANLFIGQDKFIRMTYMRYGSQQERIEAIRVGVSLNITPWTGGNGEITSSVTCEVSNIVDIDPETGIPRLSTRRAEATIRALDGETIIIGGLTQRQTERTVRRIPLLSDLPIVGGLFTSRTSRSIDTELVIFLTPRMIGPEASVDITEATAAALEEEG
jgi:type II secretory pathway component GspD/PulD (secretin)